MKAYREYFVRARAEGWERRNTMGRGSIGNPRAVAESCDPGQLLSPLLPLHLHLTHEGVCAFSPTPGAGCLLILKFCSLFYAMFEIGPHSIGKSKHKIRGMGESKLSLSQTLPDSSLARSQN